MSITVLEPGPLTTVQDAGRIGYAAQGYRSCGAADSYAYRLGNALVGNPVGAAVLEAAAVGLSMVKGAKKVVDLLTGLCQIAAPALLALAFINLVSARVEGFAFIYFSNADVLLEVQTAANMSSATCAIVNLVLLALSSIVGVVSAFFTLKK